MAADPASEHALQTAQERWHPPSVDADAGPMLTARQLENLQKQAWDEAYAQGQAAGFADGQTKVGEQIARIERIVNALSSPFAALDEQVEQEVAALSIAIASQLLRHEMRTEPAHIIAIAREAIAALPVSNGDVTLHLCPDDVALVEPALVADQLERRWRVQPDNQLGVGDCRVSCQYSRIDARLQARLDSLVGELLSERTPDDPAPPSGDPGARAPDAAGTASDE